MVRDLDSKVGMLWQAGIPVPVQVIARGATASSLARYFLNQEIRVERDMLSRGVVLQGGRQAHIVSEEVAAPEGRQVLVRTHAVGLCGSDVGLYLGTYEGPKKYPMYFGHEWSGTVEAVGPAVTQLQPGDKVTGDCSVFCGDCTYCARDRNLCQHIKKVGITVDGASRQFFLQDERWAPMLYAGSGSCGPGYGRKRSLC
jgi:Zn-dependent alcohol dehydrogenase